ncbi:TPA: TldD/PmbA family protein [Candidatus Poribacteria bacterium]|nr:TldD/PmbA family protein [Candidatus Poribacteria bacterium]
MIILRERLEEALRKSDAEYTEIRIEDVASSWISFRGEELDSIGSSKTVGGIVRALVKGGWGYSTFNDINNLNVRVKEACESAKMIGKEESKFAQVEPVVDCIKAELVKDFREILLSHKKSVIEEYNKIVLGYHEKIKTSIVAYGDSFRKIWFANSDGSYIEDERPNTTLYISATARDGDNVQHGMESTGGMTGFQIVEGFHEKAEASAKRAVELLSAPPVTGGKYTVITNPNLTGVFVHEAFGHLSEADFIYENEGMKEIMVLGKRFGSDILNIIDDGSYPGQIGTHKYDDEGVRTRKNYLIKDGILVGRLHSRETSAKMGEMPTGNARSIGYQFPPIVRMTNTYIDKGNSSFEDMIKDVKLGIYALDMIGGQTAMEMFTFSAAYAYMIRDGKIAELIRDVVLTGNVFETLLNIDMIGDKLEWAPGGPGGCGKSAQSPLPVGFGGPHIRIQNVVVGGRQ